MVKLQVFKNANKQNKIKREGNEKAEKKGRGWRGKKARQKFCFLISLLKSVR